MQITPLALHVERFKSYVQRQTFTFPQAPGLYFIQGSNEAEPRLGGNACGKTGLWDALTWCLFEKTARGLKAGDVCSWGHDKGTDVRLEFKVDDGLPQFVIRTWKPNSWTLVDLFGNLVDLAKDPANEVLAALRVEFEPFLNSVLTAQGRPMFLDMKREAQAQLFSDVMGLEAWVARAERAGKRAAAQDSVSRDLERQLAETRGRLEALDDLDAGLASDRWEKRRLDDLEALAGTFGTLKARRKQAKQDLADCEEAERGARERLRAAQDDDERARWRGPLLDEARREVRRLEDSGRDLAGRLRDLDEREEELLDEQAPCPLCGHRLEPADRKKQLGVTQAEIGLVAGRIKETERKTEGARETVREVEAQVRQWDDELEAARNAVRSSEREASAARNALLGIDREMDRVEDREDELREERNPHEDGLERTRAERARLLGVEFELLRRLDDSEWRQSVFSYWVRGFKELRLQAIAEALEELEVEVNSAVAALGLVDWELKFAVDRETKGGGVQRGFSVLVRSPGSGDRLVPWEAWSGGEGQRLRVAAQMGLADLTRARTGCALPIEVWDEPTSGLSPEGLQDLFEALAERARHEGRMVFLVDHKAHSFGGFAGTASVIKTRSGSRVRASWA